MAALPGKGKAAVGKAGRPTILGQIGYILRDDMQKERGRRIRRRAGFPQIKQPVIQFIQVKVVPGDRFRSGQGGVVGAQLVGVGRDD